MTQQTYRISINVSFYDDDIPDGFMTELELNPIPDPKGSVLDNVHKVIDKVRLKELQSLADNLEHEIEDAECLAHAYISGATVEAI